MKDNLLLGIALGLLCFAGGLEMHANEFERKSWQLGELKFDAGEQFGTAKISFTTRSTKEGAVYLKTLTFETKETVIEINERELAGFEGVLLRTLQAGVEERTEELKACYGVEFRYRGRDVELYEDMRMFPLVRIYVNEVNRVWAFLTPPGSDVIEEREIKRVIVKKKAKSR